jgi:ribosomal protein L2
VTGQITQRYIGGGHKQRLRAVDFHRRVPGEHDVVRIEYDPGRSAHIALLRARDGIDVSLEDLDIEEGAALADAGRDSEGYDGEEIAGLIGEGESSGLIVRPSPIRRSGDKSEGTLKHEKLVESLRRIDPDYLKPITLGGEKAVYAGWSYILAPDGLRAGDVVTSYRNGVPDGTVEGWINALPSSDATNDVGDPSIVSSRALGLLRSHTLKPGNVLPLYLIPPGTTVHNLSLRPNSKMALCRSAGTSAQIVAHHTPSGSAMGGTDVLKMQGGVGPDGKLSKGYGDVLIKLRSGEVRRLPPGCIATIGSVSKSVC